MKLFGAAILAATWRIGTATDLSALPWSDLEERVGDQLIHTSPQDFLDQCYPEFQKDRPPPECPSCDRTAYNLIGQPSGLCTTWLFCGFKECNPDLDYMNGQTTYAESANLNFFLLDQSNEAFNLPPEETNEQKAAALQEWMDPTSPLFNLPAKVLFPRNAADVVAAIQFAKAHGVELSVKNSGHSYSGKSTKANTLLINMNQYVQYAYDGIVECTNTTSNSIVEKNLSNQACVLATARGKPAFVRVGGGENFDKLYRSVSDFNEREFNEREGYKYHVVGGATSTVSPMGWTFEGGLSGTARGREFGFGVDQVLQIEAVLPNGEHVRFGPTNWEEVEGYLVPKTTTVSGVCNQNPQDEEVFWEWGPCPDETNVLFDDLWFAFRGGGGGTWGIVLSVYLQLHDYVSNVFVSNACDSSGALQALIGEFGIRAYLDPGSVGLSREQSNACGMPIGHRGSFLCHSNDPTIGDELVSSYRDFVSKNLGNLTNEDAAVAPSCLSAISGSSKFDRMPPGLLNLYPFRLIPSGPYEGKLPEGDGIEYTPTFLNSFSLLVPKSFILKNIKFMAKQDFYFAFGGNAQFAHDQTTSLSSAYREAGGMIRISYVPDALRDRVRDLGINAFNDNDWNPLMPDMYDFASGAIPGHACNNHLGNAMRGPLKEDPTKLCPVQNLTITQAESMCHSAQEAVWGTETLARLESIKKKVDPQGLFNCFNCVGNNIQIPSIEEESVDEDSSSVPGEIVENEPDAAEYIAESTEVDEISDGEPLAEDTINSGGEEMVDGVEGSSSAATRAFEMPMAALASIAVVILA